METLENKQLKNMRQIGEPDPAHKVFIEDYAYTHLHQLAKEHMTCMKTSILVGQADGKNTYVYGALELDMGQQMHRWFDNEHWRDAFDLAQNWFAGMEVIGWCLSNPGFGTGLTEELKTIHQRNFSGSRHLLFQMDVMEREEQIYIWEQGQLQPLSGYYIFYEKNEPMQAYISYKRKGAGIEPEGILKDQAAARFRNIMQEKKEQNSQKKTMAFLYTSCIFLVLVILVIGVTMIGSYDRMLSMENTMNQISENLEDQGSSKGQELQEVDLAAAAREENRVARENLPDVPLEPEESAGEEPAKATEEPDGGETKPEEEEPAEEEPEEPAAEEEVQEVISQAVKEPERYLVQKGDTLLGICRSRYGSEDMMQTICELNGLDDSDRIYAGETILLP